LGLGAERLKDTWVNLLMTGLPTHLKYLRHRSATRPKINPNPTKHSIKTIEVAQLIRALGLVTANDLTLANRLMDTLRNNLHQIGMGWPTTTVSMLTNGVLTSHLIKLKVQNSKEGTTSIFFILPTTLCSSQIRSSPNQSPRIRKSPPRFPANTLQQKEKFREPSPNTLRSPR